MQHFAGVDHVGVAAAIAGELRVADAEAGGDAAEGVAAAHGHGTGCRRRVAAGGDAAAAVVGDDLTGVDQVEVAAGHAPPGQRPQAGARGDAAHGVARADGHAGRVGLRGLLRRYGRGAGEALVDDRHDLVVVRAERVAPLLAVAVVATDGGGRECL